jgi:hypothetical protein
MMFSELLKGVDIPPPLDMCKGCPSGVCKQIRDLNKRLNTDREMFAVGILLALFIGVLF